LGLWEVVEERVGGGDDVVAGPELDGAVTPGGLHEPADEPSGLVLDPAADSQDGQDDGQVRLDRVPLAVVDRPGLQVALGHSEALFDPT
jgi:hypothetical protein